MRRDKFVIMSTDGLWDQMTPAEAVKIVFDAFSCDANQGLETGEVVKLATRALIDHAMVKVS